MGHKRFQTLMVFRCWFSFLWSFTRLVTIPLTVLFVLDFFHSPSVHQTVLSLSVWVTWQFDPPPHLSTKFPSTACNICFRLSSFSPCLFVSLLPQLFTDLCLLYHPVIPLSFCPLVHPSVYDSSYHVKISESRQNGPSDCIWDTHNGVQRCLFRWLACECLQ